MYESAYFTFLNFRSLIFISSRRVRKIFKSRWCANELIYLKEYESTSPPKMKSDVLWIRTGSPNSAGTSNCGISDRSVTVYCVGRRELLGVIRRPRIFPIGKSGSLFKHGCWIPTTKLLARALVGSIACLKEKINFKMI